MQIIILTDNLPLATRLTRPHGSGEDATVDLPGPFRIAEPRLTPGALGGWFEIAVSFGLTSVPASIAASLIANWIWHALKTEDSRDGSIKFRIKDGSNSNNITLNEKNLEEITEILRKALEDANKYQ